MRHQPELALARRKVAHLEPAELDVLGALAERLRLEPGRFVFSQGDATRNFYLLERGRVRVFYQLWSGRELTIFHCEPGDFFGLAEAVSLEPRSASAQALEASVAWSIPCAALPQIARELPRFMLRIAAAMSSRLHETWVLMESVVTLPMRARVANFVLGAARAFRHRGAPVTIEGLTHERIAQILNCSRQTLTMVLNEFSREGLVRIERKRLLLLDPRRLQRETMDPGSLVLARPGRKIVGTATDRRPRQEYQEGKSGNGRTARI